LILRAIVMMATLFQGMGAILIAIRKWDGSVQADQPMVQIHDWLFEEMDSLILSLKIETTETLILEMDVTKHVKLNQVINEHMILAQLSILHVVRFVEMAKTMEWALAMMVTWRMVMGATQLVMLNMDIHDLEALQIQRIHAQKFEEIL
jgi:hypothetical protein